MAKKQSSTIIIVIILLIVLTCVILLASLGTNKQQGTQSTSAPTLHIVAAENFWGSLISQLGGDKVSVTSIVTDPNADPHEYESNTADARLFANADYVIQNGAGYDSWATNLLSASTNPKRKVLVISDLLGKKEGANPHFWYQPDYVNTVVATMESDLIALDPSNADYYKAQYAKLQSSLAEYQNRIIAIKKQFAGTKVAATEDIFVYLGQSTGLDLISPPEFIQAIGEGNDPSAQSVVEFENQLKAGTPRVLVYNSQTVTPITENMKKIAADNHIPIVGITETIQPPTMPFQDWMDAELINIQNTLEGTIVSK